MGNPNSQTTDSDELLLDRWRQRDAVAFEGLFHRYYGPIYRSLYSLVGCREEAEDLAQETFLVLYHRPPRSTEAGGLLAWLRRVSLNRGYNALRSARRRRLRIEQMDPPTNGEDPQDAVMRSEDRERVRRALSKLPERQCQILMLRQDGLSYAEIAVLVRVAPGSIGTLLSRAERAFLKVYQEAEAVEKRSPVDLRSVL